MAKADMWMPDEGPELCGSCNSPTYTELRYVPDDKLKHRRSLIRALVWYGLNQPEELSEGLRPYVFPDGHPAVELSFRLPIPLYTDMGEQYILAGHLDLIGQFGDEIFPVDQKTTRKTLNDKFFASYSPSTQFDTYDMVMSVMFPDLETVGIMVDAVQLLTDGVKFGRFTYRKTEAQREEHWADMQEWIKEAERYATRDHWPMNKRNCWICPFNGVCSLSPEKRQTELETSFQRGERWDPLKERE
jgi:hypothetical protein